jgi:dihydroxyacetone kinase
MTRLFNQPTQFKEEMIDGFISAYGRYVERILDASGVMVAGGPEKGKVSVLIGGGSGHYPAFCGMVGKGMATGAVIGEIFTSPSSEQILRCTRALDTGAGVLYSYGNYSGDVMNFDLAQMRAEVEGHAIRQVLVTDDVASSDLLEARRGVAGDFHVFKVAGASAWRGDSLDMVEAFARRANAMTRSIGVAFGGCTIPGQPQPLFTVATDRMEVGMGIHGEPGVETALLVPAAELAEMIVDRLLQEAPAEVGSLATVMVNGLGATHYEELFVLYGTVSRLLHKAGIDIYAPLVGEFATSLNMEGFSLTLMWLDDELRELYDAPASTPGFTKA